MTKNPPVAIRIFDTTLQSDTSIRVVQHPDQCPAGSLGEWLRGTVFTGHLWCVDPDQPDMTTIFQHHRIAVDDVAYRNRLTTGSDVAIGLGERIGRREQEREEGQNAKGAPLGRPSSGA
ncbi:MAG: hypothetical protein Kow006_07550 [Gammaproteobacteria bacterium]